jgi:hypothetical protein
MALSREAALPSGVFGPVELLAFSRLIAARLVGGFIGVTTHAGLSMSGGEFGDACYFWDVIERVGESSQKITVNA